MNTIETSSVQIAPVAAAPIVSAPIVPTKIVSAQSLFVEDKEIIIKGDTNLQSYLVNNSVDMTGMTKLSNLRLEVQGGQIVLHVKNGESIVPCMHSRIGSMSRFVQGIVTERALETLMTILKIDMGTILKIALVGAFGSNDIWNLVNDLIAKRTEYVRLVLNWSSRNEMPVIKGIVSPRYTLVTDECMLNSFESKTGGAYTFDHAILSQSRSEYVFLHNHEGHKERSMVGSIIRSGLKLINSEGSKTTAIKCLGYLLRLICSNGATSSQETYSARQIHTGHPSKWLYSINDVIENTNLLLPRIDNLYDLRLNQMIVQDTNDKVESIIGKKWLDGHEPEWTNPDLAPESLDRAVPWNWITEKAKSQTSDKRLKMENLGFDYLVKWSGTN